MNLTLAFRLTCTPNFFGVHLFYFGINLHIGPLVKGGPAKPKVLTGGFFIAVPNQCINLRFIESLRQPMAATSL